jgi:hypothetical protein
MGKKTQAKREPTRAQIEVWLPTVLTPILNSLTVELHYVARGTWSFRSDSQDFEYLYPISKMVAAPYRANLEQVFRYYPSLETEAASHDHELDGLRTACQVAYGSLLRSTRFKSLPAPESEGNRGYLAEYVINRYRELPSHYVLAEFWNKYGARYLKLRLDSVLSPRFKSIDTHGASFKRALVELSTSARKLQQRIADDAGLAPSNPSVP